MTILIAFAITALGEFVKPISKKFGEKNSRRIVLGSVFIASVVYTILTSAGIITQENIQQVVTLALSAVGTYELVVKSVVYPAIKK